MAGRKLGTNLSLGFRAYSLGFRVAICTKVSPRLHGTGHATSAAFLELVSLCSSRSVHCFVDCFMVSGFWLF